jgi:hypothetical protein
MLCHSVISPLSWPVMSRSGEGRRRKSEGRRERDRERETEADLTSFCTDTEGGNRRGTCRAHCLDLFTRIPFRDIL